MRSLPAQLAVLALMACASVSPEQRSPRDYVDAIRAAIRRNVVIPEGVPANAEVTFVVIQRPSGEVVDVRLGRSSGFKAYDKAIEDAILRSSPLPTPRRPEWFVKGLELHFRPQ